MLWRERFTFVRSVRADCLSLALYRESVCLREIYLGFGNRDGAGSYRAVNTV